MISNSGHDENGKLSGGAAGDQTGGEWAVRSWYSRPWSVVLRYPDIMIGILIAQLAEEAAKNNKIGYDQSQRGTFWQALKAADYYPANIKTACESDCSAGVAAIVKAAGYISGLTRLQAVSADMYTGNERSVLTGAGFSALTESKYLTSDEYLLPGDVLLYEGHHTAINLDQGSKATVTITNELIKNSVANVAKRAKAEHWSYGDCHTNPPCPPIACERGIDRALWDLSPQFRDQKAGGETTYTIDGWLVKHGFIKNTDQSKVKKNSIVFMKWTGSAAFDWRDHVFYCVDYNPATGMCIKYDFGEQWRIDKGSYFSNVPFNQWTDTPIRRRFYASYQWPENTEADPYLFKPVRILSGAVGKSQFMVTRALKARDYKGVKKNGELQDLELNDKYTKGDVAAVVKYKWDRMVNGKNLCDGILADECNQKFYEDLFGMPLPIQCVNVPAQCTSGPLILMLQEVLRSECFTGKDGKPIDLDQQWGPNTEYGVIQYQKLYGFEPNGKVTYSVWKHMCTNRTPKKH